MSLQALIEPHDSAAALLPLRADALAPWLAGQPPEIRRWVADGDFQAKAHTSLRLPTAEPMILVGLGERQERWRFAGFPLSLPPGDYALSPDAADLDTTLAAVDWALGAYAFSLYKPPPREAARLCWPAGCDRAAVARDVGAMTLARDLINTPAADMGPAELEAATRALAEEFGATVNSIVGDRLVEQGYNLIHAVGRASPREPRLLDLTWGDPSAPKVTLAGKGVCFDTGGLNIKSWGGMLYMKLDMGGAAHVLALARMIMEARLPVRLRVLIPAVENAVSGDAVRPLDVVEARNGLTVEIANTDAEGRLLLADALCEASREKPDLVIDVATLTGSARVALGPDLTALFCNDDAIAAGLEASARKTQDPLWRLPLWADYASDLDGKVGDVTNVADLNLGYTTSAGAIYAALFLEKFVEPGTAWIHLDTFGWNMKARPGRPQGGESRNLFALFHMLEQRYRLEE